MPGRWRITEAFSEYCASFVVRQVRGKDGYRDLVEEWQENARVANDKAPIAQANRLFSNDFENYFDRSALIYDKGALFLAALHDEIGDGAFASFLRSSQKGWEWKFANTRHMPMILERLTGEDYTEMFEECFWGNKMPKTPKVLKGS